MAVNFPEEIVDTIQNALLILKEDLTVEFANRNFYYRFDVEEGQTEGRKLYELGDGQWDIPKLRLLLEDIIPSKTMVENYIVEHDFPAIGRKVMRLNARKTDIQGNGSRRILLAIDDITAVHDTERALDRERRLTRGMVDTVREPLLVLDGELRVTEASRAFYRGFEVSPEATLGERIEDLGNGQWKIPKLLELLHRIIPDNETIEDYLVDHEFPTIGVRSMCLNARKIYREGNNSKTILLAIEDITERRRLETEREAALQRSNALMEELNHRVMNSLTMIGAIMSLESRNFADSECAAAFGRIRSRVDAVSGLYRSLTKQSAVDTVDASEYICGLADNVVASVGNDCKVVCKIDRLDLTTRTAIPLGLIVNELVTNAIKYAFGEGQGDSRVMVSLEDRGDDSLLLTVRDNGSGIDEAKTAESGMGTRLIRGLATQVNGAIKRSSGPDGTEVRMEFEKAA